jgi:CRISPR-associated protein Csy1
VQNFGGTKPQNISQLNSERRGEAYLLPSLPPHWQTAVVKPPLHAESVFAHIFGYRGEVQRLTKTLRIFLGKVQDYNNIQVREKRAEMVSQVIDELVQYAARVHELDPGWSQATDCRLNEEEQLWLDPGRADLDQEFRRKYESGEWRTAVSGRFARWLNRRIEAKHIPMGDPEFLEWKREVEAML